MIDNSQLVTPSTDQFLPSRRGAGVVVTIVFMFIIPSGRAQTNHQQYAFVVRVDAKNTGLTPNDIIVRVENVRVPAIAIQAFPETPRSIAIVVDAGPDQAKV